MRNASKGSRKYEGFRCLFMLMYQLTVTVRLRLPLRSGVVNPVTLDGCIDVRGQAIEFAGTAGGFAGGA